MYAKGSSHGWRLWNSLFQSSASTVTQGWEQDCFLALALSLRVPLQLSPWLQPLAVCPHAGLHPGPLSQS